MIDRLNNPRFVGWTALVWAGAGLSFLGLSGALEFLGSGGLDKAKVITVLIILGGLALMAGGAGLIDGRQWGARVTMISAAFLLVVFLPVGPFLIKLSVPIFLDAVKGVLTGEWDMAIMLALAALPSLYIVLNVLLLLGGYFCRHGAAAGYRG